MEAEAIKAHVTAAGQRQIKVTYSSTNEKSIEDVITNLIKSHERKGRESKNDNIDRLYAPK